MFGITVDVLYHLVAPFKFLSIVATFIPATVATLVLNLNFRTLLSPSAFKDAWFARFWGIWGPKIREGRTPFVEPLIKQAHGVILDIGPGPGEWIALFDKEKVTKIYGIEPNADHHPRLRERILAAGLEDKYIIVPVGIEDISDKWVEKGSVDAIVTVLCLCSIPRPKFMIVELYQYIKDGGIWILYEHVKAKEGRRIAPYQKFVNLFWPHFLGGCSLTRDTEKFLKSAGSWSKVDLMQPEDEPTYQVVPHVKGILVK